LNEKTDSVTEFRMLGAELTQAEALQSLPKKVRVWLGMPR
jgi:hypothetical protein